MKSLKHLFIGVAMIGLLSAMASKSFGSPGENKEPVLSEVTVKSDIAIFNLVTPEVVTLSKTFTVEKESFRFQQMDGCGRIEMMVSFIDGMSTGLLAIDSAGNYSVMHNLGADSNYYPVPYLSTHFKFGWLDIADNVSQWKKDIFRNRF
jgi:hypothetical protein